MTREYECLFLNQERYKGAFAFALAVVLLVPALVQQHVS